MKIIIAKHTKIIHNTLLVGAGVSLIIGTTFKIAALYCISSLLLISWYICIDKLVA